MAKQLPRRTFPKASPRASPGPSRKARAAPGPAAGDAMVAELGFRRGEDYAWRSFSQRGTPRITPRATPKGSPQISRSPSAKRLDLSPGGVPLKSGPGGSNGNTPPRADGLPPRSPARGLAPSP